MESTPGEGRLVKVNTHHSAMELAFSTLLKAQRVTTENTSSVTPKLSTLFSVTAHQTVNAIGQEDKLPLNCLVNSNRGENGGLLTPLHKPCFSYQIK